MVYTIVFYVISFILFFSGKRTFYLPEPNNTNNFATLDIPSTSNKDLDPSEPICLDTTLFERQFTVQ